MRTWIAVALTLALALGLFACGMDRPDEQIPFDPPGESLDATVPTGTTPLPSEDTTEPTNPDPLSECVRTAREEILTDSTGDGGQGVYRYPVVSFIGFPSLPADGQEADTWSYWMAWEMEPIFDGLVAAYREGTTPEWASIDYQAWLLDDLLTVLVTMEPTEPGHSAYRIGCFDRETGEELDSDEMFCLVSGAETPAALRDVVALHLGQWFDDTHAHMAQDEALAGQREKTMALENLRHTQLYVDADGQLRALVPAYTLPDGSAMDADFPLTDFSPMEVNQPPAEDATLEDLVTVYRSAEFPYTTSYGEETLIELNIPYVNIQTPDGRECNWRIRNMMEFRFDDALQGYEDRDSLTCRTIAYDAWIWEEMLVVKVLYQPMAEYTDELVFVLDLETGAFVSNQEVADRMGIGSTWQADLTQAMEQRYVEKYSFMENPEEDPFYQQQLALTISEENVLAAMVYPNAQGQVEALCQIHSLAGAAFYWHTVPVTPN